MTRWRDGEMTRLLFDLVRRGWAVLLILGGVAFLSAGYLTQHSVGTNVTLLLMMTLGAHLATFLSVRVIHVLPTTPRERWLTALSVGGVVMPTTWLVGSVLGLLLPWAQPAATAIEPLALVTMFAALYCVGATLLVPAFEGAGRVEPAAEVQLRETGARPRIETSGFGRMLVLMGIAALLVVAPLRWGHLIPLSLSGFTLVSTAIVVVVAGVALWAVLWTPARPVFLPTRGLSADVLGPPDSYLLAQKRRLDYLTGPARVLVPSFLGLTLASVLVMAAASLAAYFLEASSGEIRTAMSETGMLILEPTGVSASSRSFHKNFAALVMFLSLASPLAGLHRLLVLMPLSRLARIALPIGGQALNVSGLWLGVIIHHVVATGAWPTTVRGEFWLLAIGTAAFLHALADRFDWTKRLEDKSGFRRGAVFGGAIGVSGILFEVWPRVVPAESQLEIVVGLAALSIAGAVAVRTWTT